jgi:hypothetical protein
LPKARFDKLFTAEEANELIPRLEILVRDIQLAAAVLREQVAELADDDLELAELELSELVARFPQLREVATRLANSASQIDSLGCFLKDIDQGLVDFPCDAGKAVVFLCWQFGEPQVVAWHTIEGGFAGRRPLPGVAKPYLN